MKLKGLNIDGKILFVNENDIEKYGSIEEAVKVIHFPPEEVPEIVPEIVAKPIPKGKKVDEVTPPIESEQTNVE